jgi:hypothetical protein
MVPTPYDMRWTSRLVYRDLRNLAAGCTNRLRGIISSFRGTSDPIVNVRHTDKIGPVPNSNTRHEVEQAPIDAGTLRDTTPQDFAPSSSCSSASVSMSTLPTEVSHMSLEDPNTLYSLLGSKLKDLYAHRERRLPLDERWIFRGAWLLLHMATQCCASNPTHDILKPGSSSSNETALLLEVLRKYTSLRECQPLTCLEEYSISEHVNLSTSRVSQMPVIPFTKSEGTATRHDSVYDTLSTKHPPTPPSALFWHTIFVGATDRTKTVQAAKYLLRYVWSEKNADATLEAMGNPAKRLSGDDNTELRKRLGTLLCPEHNALC